MYGYANENEPKQRWKIIRGIMVSGWIMTLVTMLSLIGTCLYLWGMGRSVPDPLLALAGVAVSSLLKDFAVTLSKFIEEDK